MDYEIDKRQSVSVLWNSILNDYHNEEFQQLLVENLNLGTHQLVDYSSRDHCHNSLNNGISAFYRGRFGTWNVNAAGGYSTSGWDMTSIVERSSDYYLDDSRHHDTHYVWGSANVDKFIGNKWIASLNGQFLSSEYDQTRLGSDLLLSDNSTTFGNVTAQFQYTPSRKFVIGALAGAHIYHNSAGGMTVNTASPLLMANLSWVPSQNFVLRASYNSYSEDPTIDQSADYGNFTDSLIYKSGNSALKPAVYHTVRLNFAMFNQLTFVTTYTRVNNNIFNIVTAREIEGRQVAFHQYQNGTADMFTLGLNYQKSFPCGLDLSVFVQETYMKGSYKEMSQSRWRPSGSVTLYYRNPKLFNATLDYTVRRILGATPQGRTWGSPEVASLAVERYLCNNRLSLQLMWAIPVGLFHADYTKGWLKSPALETYIIKKESYYNHNILAFTLTYRFSGGERVKRYNRSTISR